VYASDRPSGSVIALSITPTQPTVPTCAEVNWRSSRGTARSEGTRIPTLTAVAGTLYRLLALKLPRYENAPPDKIWRHFLDASGTLHITADAVTCALHLRSHHPALIDVGFADLDVPFPWWDRRTLRFRFPPR
jgi:hypothetical protein